MDCVLNKASYLLTFKKCTAYYSCILNVTHSLVVDDLLNQAPPTSIQLLSTGRGLQLFVVDPVACTFACVLLNINVS